jgi:hypothetical protein
VTHSKARVELVSELLKNRSAFERRDTSIECAGSEKRPAAAGPREKFPSPQ